MANTQGSIGSDQNAERSAPALSGALLGWYDVAARVLPWRSPPNAKNNADPYHVWLSEVMLQQTTVAAVIPYFEKFLKVWPSVEALATADRDDVLAAWAGLGYYARARNLHKCAGVVASELGGHFPDNENDLLALPGIGPYTAAAIAAIAFDRSATVVDGNVERVISRLYAIDEPLPKSKPMVRALAAQLTPDERSGDYAQAIMDLGASVCSPRNPACGNCPWSGTCLAFEGGAWAEYPRRAKKNPRPKRTGTAYWLESDGYVYLRRRPDKGLLGGMLEVPSSEWCESDQTEKEADGLADAAKNIAKNIDWQPMAGLVHHVFTHFELELSVIRASVATRPRDLDAGNEGGIWHPVSDIDNAGLPSVMRKVAKHVCSAMGADS